MTSVVLILRGLNTKPFVKDGKTFLHARSQEVRVPLKLDCLKKLLWSKTSLLIQKLETFVAVVSQSTRRVYIVEVIELNGEEVHISFLDHKGPLIENLLF